MAANILIGHAVTVLAAFLAIVSGLQYFKYRTPTTRWAGLFLFCLAGELLCFAVQMMKDPSSPVSVLYAFQVIFFFSFSVFWSLFIIYMAGYSKKTNIWIIVSIFLVSAIVMILLQDEPLIGKRSIHPFFGFRESFFNLPVMLGQAGRYFIALFYSIGAVCSIFLFRFLLYSESKFKNLLFPMFLGTLFFYGLAILEHSGVDPYKPYHLTQLGLILLSFAIYFIAVIWRFGGILPISRESVFEGLHDGVLLLDWQNNIIDVNKSAQTILDVKRSAVIKKNLSSFWPVGDALFSANPTKAFISEECILTINQQDFTFGVNISRLFGINQALMGSMMVLRNITSRERMEAALHERARELQRTNAFLESLAELNVKIHGATDPGAINEILGEEFKKLGLVCFIARIDPVEHDLVLSYFSVKSDLMSQAEKIFGRSIVGFHLDKDQFAPLYDILESKQTSFRRFKRSDLEDVPGKIPLGLIERAIRMIGLAPDMATLILPLYTRERILGVMGVWGQDLRESDIASFPLFASQVANVMDRAILYDLEIRRSAELSRVNSLTLALSTVASVVGSTSNSDVVLDTLGTELKKAGLDCAIVSIDGDGEVAYLKYLSFNPKLVGKVEKLMGLQLDGFAIPRKYWPGARIIEHQVPVWYSDPRQILVRMFPMVPRKIAERAAGILGIDEEEQICFLPLIQGADTIGAMVIWGPTMKQVDSPILSVFSSQVAGIISQIASLELQVQRTDDLARANAMIIVLSRVAARLDAMNDLEQVFNTLGEELLTVQISCMVGLLDESKTNLDIKHLSLPLDVHKLANKFGNLWPNEISIPRRLWPSEQVVSDGIPFWDEDPVGSTVKMFPFAPRIVFEKAYHSTGIESDGKICYLPMVNNEDVIGVLAMWGPDLQHEDIAALSVFANQIAIAISNIRLYNQAQKEIEDRRQAEARIREALEDKEVLLKEVHHRVKNNLQVISSLLNLQSSQIEDEKTVDLLRESQNRVRSMALIHEKLYQSSDLARVDFQGYLHSLVNSLMQTYRVYSEQVVIDVKSEELAFSIDTAIPCGLIVNELVSNSLKYAFAKGNPGKIEVICENIRGSQYRLTIRDNGTGLPEGFDVESSSSLGLKLVTSLVRQINGELIVQNKQGACFVIEFLETEAV